MIASVVMLARRGDQVEPLCMVSSHVLAVCWNVDEMGKLVINAHLYGRQGSYVCIEPVDVTSVGLDTHHRRVCSGRLDKSYAR